MKDIINEQSITYSGGENLNLQEVLMLSKHSHFKDKVKFTANFLRTTENLGENLYRRIINSPADTIVDVLENNNGVSKKMLMFGSNNYLGLANHPLLKEKVFKLINKYGIGIGGPPLLNGHTFLHSELENKLADFKRKEAAMVFSSGYNTNVGLLMGLCSDRKDILVYDEYSHASLYDGIKASRIPALPFKHNDMENLQMILENEKNRNSKFVAVEGIYSMDGDMSPLMEVVSIARKHDATTLLDDAHGSLILGESGRGTANYLGVEKDIDVIMGTFSKAFAVTGGFLAASKDIIEHMRFFSKPYMFSASMPIPIVASILAALELNEEMPELRIQLFDNVRYAESKLSKFGLVSKPKGAIIALKVPPETNIRKAARMFHDKGIFINSIEYPAVPRSEQRFRISLMATHTKEQIDRLVEVVEEVLSIQKN